MKNSQDIADNLTPYDNPTAAQYALYALSAFSKEYLNPGTKAFRDMHRITSELQTLHEKEWVERLKP